MTKRKRTPSSSPPPRVRFQIPASLQRLSMISRSLAHQSDRLAGLSQDDHNVRIIAQVQAQAPGGAPPVVVATSAGIEARDGQGHGFRAFAPHKQPSLPDAQTWVEPKPGGTQVADDAGFMSSTQPLFPQGQAWPQPQPGKVIPWPQPQSQTTIIPAPAQAPEWVPPSVPQESALADLESPPPDGETLCLETQPNRIAALIAQKRAANEANRRREAWTRQAAAHLMSSQAPDDQLLNELNSTVGQSSTADNSAQKHTSATNDATRSGTGERQTVKHPQQYVTPTAPITFDPILPSTGVQADRRTAAQTQNGPTLSKETGRGQTSAPSTRSRKEIPSNDHDSVSSSSDSPSPSHAGRLKPGGSRNQYTGQQPNQHDSSVAQLSTAASTAPPVDTKAPPIPSNSAKTKSNSRYPDTSFVRQAPQSNHAKPVAAGYYRFNPRHWQTGNTTQQSQAFAQATQSGYQRIEASGWPASHDVLQKVPPNPVFRNLTQDKFGRFGVGGKLKEAVGQ